MAGDWIKVEFATLDKPEVAQMATDLKIDMDAVLGKLLRVWAWANQQTTDGNAPSVTKALLDRCTCVTGFCDAMQKVGWLVEENGTITFPKFDRHMSNSAKSRAQGTERTKKSRNQERSGATDCNESVTPEALQKRYKSVTREEKRREDIDLTKVRSKEPPIPYPQPLKDWLEYRTQIRKPLKIASLNAILKKYENKEADLRRDVEHSIAQGYQGLFSPKDGNGFKTAKEREREEEEARSARALEIWGINPEDVP